jgi:hypothetical protein
MDTPINARISIYHYFKSFFTHKKMKLPFMDVQEILQPPPDTCSSRSLSSSRSGLAAAARHLASAWRCWAAPSPEDWFPNGVHSTVMLSRKLHHLRQEKPDTNTTTNHVLSQHFLSFGSDFRLHMCNNSTD